MCVGLSAKVVRVKDKTAIVDAGGAKREVSAELLRGLEPGDYVMVHAGAAIAKITDDDEDEANWVLDSILPIDDEADSNEKNGSANIPDTIASR